jgi:hypothetical protein
LPVANPRSSRLKTCARICALGLVAALTTATALATSPRLDAIRPAGGPRGSELELRFEGARLENAEDIIFYSPGFEVVQLQPATKTNACAARPHCAGWPPGRTLVARAHGQRGVGSASVLREPVSQPRGKGAE